MEIADEYKKLGIKVGECLFCQKDVSKGYYMFRDPYKNEEKQIIKKTLQSIK